MHLIEATYTAYAMLLMLCASGGVAAFGQKSGAKARNCGLQASMWVQCTDAPTQSQENFHRLDILAAMSGGTAWTSTKEVPSYCGKLSDLTGLAKDAPGAQYVKFVTVTVYAGSGGTGWGGEPGAAQNGHAIEISGWFRDGSASPQHGDKTTVWAICDIVPARPDILTGCACTGVTEPQPPRLT